MKLSIPVNSGGLLVTLRENEKFVQALGLQRDPCI